MIAYEQDCGLITVSFTSFLSTHSLHESSHWIIEHPISREHKTDLDIIKLIRLWYKGKTRDLNTKRGEAAHRVQERWKLFQSLMIHPAETQNQ